MAYVLPDFNFRTLESIKFVCGERGSIASRHPINGWKRRAKRSGRHHRSAEFLDPPAARKPNHSFEGDESAPKPPQRPAAVSLPSLLSRSPAQHHDEQIRAFCPRSSAVSSCLSVGGSVRRFG